MKTPIKIAGVTAMLILSVGCSTIQFENGKSSSALYKNSEWHHLAAFTLLEASDPVDLHDRCNGKPWETVTTERTFLNGLAGMVDSLIIGIDLWEPWTVEYSCLEGA